jgi:hypothetical protein
VRVRSFAFFIHPFSTSRLRMSDVKREYYPLLQLQSPETCVCAPPLRICTRCERIHHTQIVIVRYDETCRVRPQTSLDAAASMRVFVDGVDLTAGAAAGELGIPVTCLAGRWLEGAEEFSGVTTAIPFLVGQGYKQVCGTAAAWGDGKGGD